MVTVESKDIIITRVSDRSFNITVGDIIMDGKSDGILCGVGDTITIPIPSMLVLRKSTEAYMAKIDER